MTTTQHLRALQRCDQFVGRTTNWLYDHLRFVPRYTPVVFCNLLMNRQEFPELQAWSPNTESLTRRLWRRLTASRLYPADSRRLRKFAPCILHSHFGYVAVEDRLLQRHLDVPWVVSFYGADVYQLGRLEQWRARYAPVFERAVRVLALGPVMAQHLEQIGCPREKIRIHPLGIDVESLPVKPRTRQLGEPLRVLFAGTFREKKGVRYVIESAALAQRAGVRLELHLVGDAAGKPGDHETKDAIFQQVRQLNLEDVTTHYSFLSFQELVALALRAHVFVAPSITAADGDAEGTPFVLQQMMATGMPALATLHSDIPFLFGEHKHLLVPERDAKILADRLQMYAENAEAVINHGMALREQMRRSFDVRSCAAHLSEIYDEIRGRSS